MSDVMEKTKSPKGELEWVNISGDGKENMSGNMQYVTTVVLDPDNNEDHAAFIESIEDYWEENKPKGWKKEAKSMGFYPHSIKTKETDEDGDPIYEETGKVAVSFKTAIEYPDGSAKVVKTYNAKAKEVQLGNKKVGNGSIGYAAGAMDIYEVKSKSKTTDAGVTLYLDSIQITKFVEFVQEVVFEEDDEEGGWDGEDDWEGEEAEEQEEVEEQEEEKPKSRSKRTKPKAKAGGKRAGRPRL